MKAWRGLHERRLGGAVLLALMIVLLSSCGSSGAGTTGEAGGKNNANGAAGQTEQSSTSKGEEGKAKETSTEPVTLVLYLATGTLTNDEFQAFFADPVKQKYPNITMKFVPFAKGSMPEDMVASGAQMDLIYTSVGGLPQMRDLGLFSDLNGMAKSSNMDLNRFRADLLGFIKSNYGQPGQLVALPFSQNGSAMFYNKDIFDKFGVPYPTDGMTWDQVIELSKRVGRTDSGVDYHPVFIGSLSQFANQLSPWYTDPKTDAPMLESEPWKKGATYYKEISALPNYEGGTKQGFFKEKNIALYPNVTIFSIGQIEDLYAKGETFNWDLASYPHFPETKGTGMPIDVHTLVIPSTSKYKEQAFQVMSLVTGEENQLKAARKGRISGLTAKAPQEQFGADLPSLKGKHLSSIFEAAPAITNNGAYYKNIDPLIAAETPKLLSGAEDVNTFLRSLNEQAAQAVQGAKQK